MGPGLGNVRQEKHNRFKEELSVLPHHSITKKSLPMTDHFSGVIHLQRPLFSKFGKLKKGMALKAIPFFQGNQAIA